MKSFNLDIIMEILKNPALYTLETVIKAMAEIREASPAPRS
jgi:hypothetical protein